MFCRFSVIAVGEKGKTNDLEKFNTAHSASTHKKKWELFSHFTSLTRL